MIDLNSLLGKTENDGATPAGNLTAAEWNKLVEAVIENQGGVRSINFQNTVFKPDENGVLNLIFVTDAEKYNMVAKVTKTLDEITVRGNSNTITFEYNCYFGGDVADMDTEPAEAAFLVNGTRIDELTTSLKASGKVTNNAYTVDLGPYLTAEENTVQMIISNSHGSSRVWNFACSTKEIKLSFDPSYDETIPRSSAWPLRVSCTGTEADVHVIVDDDPASEQIVHISNSTYDFTIDAAGSLGFGRHKVTIYAENAEFGIRTDSIVTYYIKLGSLSPTVAIGKDAPSEAMLYDTVKVPYYFYAPAAASGSDITVGLAIYDTNGLLVETLTSQVVSLQDNHSSGLQIASFILSSEDYVNTTICVRVQVAGAYVDHALKISSAGVNLALTPECKVYYNFTGRSNSDEGADNLVSTYQGKQTSRLVRSDNFKLGPRSGFGANGKNGFTIPVGKRLTLEDWFMFGTDFGANATDQTARTGRTLEIEFEAGLCSDMNTPIITCMDGNTGFEIFPTKAVVKCSAVQSGVDPEYPDETRQRLSIVIDGSATHCVADTGNSNSSANFDGWCNLAYIYLNGTCVRIFEYKTAKWVQNNPAKIVFGSDDCEVILYSIGAWDKALKPQQIIDNLAYGTPNLEDKVAIARRNDILNSDGTVSFAKVRKQLPNTPVITWDVEQLPTSKSDERVIKGTEFINPTWDKDRDGYARAPFTAGEHLINGDGTSSNNYPNPYKNWAEEFTGGLDIDLGNGNIEHVDDYSITPGIDGGETEFVHKVNFASSEGIFNLDAMNFFQKLLLGVATTFPAVLSKFQQGQADLGRAITYRKSLSGFPEVGFRKNTAAGQTEPKFLSIYNFINNKYSRSFLGYPKDYTKAQIWEIDDNKNFYNQKIYDSHVEIINGVETVVLSNAVGIPIYYARVPKKSPVTGQKLGIAGTVGDIAQANDEIQVLKRYHNFIVDCNPNVAERYKARYGDYRTFSAEEDGFTSRTYGSITYTKDTPSYRRAKFSAEYEGYINKWGTIFYFLYNVYELCTDSMDKNDSVGFDDCASQAPTGDHYERDTDTKKRFNNSGIKMFKYWHEWNDSYDPNTGETGEILGERWNPDTQAYELVCSAGSEIFNGRLSGLWDLVSQCWGQDIKTMYDKMVSCGLNSATMMAEYRSYWSQFCEALYNADAMGYANTGNFAMAYGDKLMESEFFAKFRERYMDSKYMTGTCTINNAMLRLFTAGKPLALRHYCPIYACVAWGSGNYTNKRSLIPGEPALMPNGITDSGGEQVFVVCNADLVTEISTYDTDAEGNIVESGLEGLGEVYFQTGMTSLKRLKNLVMDYSGTEAGNTKQTDAGFDISTFRLLRKLVVRKVVNVVSEQAINSEVIEYIDYRDTPISGILIPETESLHTCHLPATLSTLPLVNLPNLATFSLQGGENMTSLQVVGCPKVNSQSIVEVCLDRDERKLREVEIDNINWKDFAIDHLVYLANIGAKLSGTVALATSATDTLDYAQKQALMVAFGDIDNPENTLHVSYTKRNISAMSITGRSYIYDLGDYQYIAVPSPSGANYFSPVEWSISDESYATINPVTGMVTLHTVATAGSPTAVITAKTTRLSDGVEIVAQKTIGLYKRAPRTGDYAYADGTFDDVYDRNKTVVGVVYQIDEAEDGLIRIASGIWEKDKPWGINSSSNPPGDIADLPNITTANGSSGSLTINAANYLNADQNDFKEFPGGAILDWDGRGNTQKIIAYRNEVFAAADLELPSSIAALNDAYNAYVAAGSSSPDYVLRLYLYYPASYCHLYEPSLKAGEQLADFYKRGQWYLPAAGELCRLRWWHLNGYVPPTTEPAYEVKRPIFAAASAAINSNSDVVFQKFAGAGYWSSTEYNAGNAWYVNFSNGSFSSYSKNYNYYVFAVVAVEKSKINN